MRYLSVETLLRRLIGLDVAAFLLAFVLITPIAHPREFLLENAIELSLRDSHAAFRQIDWKTVDAKEVSGSPTTIEVCPHKRGFFSSSFLCGLLVTVPVFIVAVMLMNRLTSGAPEEELKELKRRVEELESEQN